MSGFLSCKKFNHEGHEVHEGLIAADGGGSPGPVIVLPEEEKETTMNADHSHVRVDLCLSVVKS
jgi:hypothetical protein